MNARLRTALALLPLLAAASTAAPQWLCRFRDPLDADRLALADRDPRLQALEEGLPLARLEAAARLDGRPILLLEPLRAEDAPRLGARLAARGDLLWSQPNRAIAVSAWSADSLVGEQWGLAAVRAPEAWALAGGEDVVLAVLDTGIDWNHPDLAGRWAGNPGEDLDGDGPFEADGAGGWRLDPDDLDGLDSDGNGYVDDLCGWDFVDQPERAGGGDRLGRDNGTEDEHGHGTAMASIAAGAAGDGRGLAGVAPGARILPLRAGSADGWLETDDALAAVVYAAERGARVLNLSFGEEEEAPALRDALAWARERGVLAVASAGNTGDRRSHWPSDWPEVLSVGSARPEENGGFARSSFSSFGPGLDLLAPGDGVLAADLAGGWRRVSGTSAATAFASGAAALLASLDPAASAARLAAALRVSARDLGPPGPDDEHGQGLLDAYAALSENAAPLAEWLAPAEGAGFNPLRDPPAPLVATARGDLAAGWRIELLAPGGGRRELASGSGPALAETLAWLDPALELVPEGDWGLELRMETVDGRELRALRRVRSATAPPRLLAEEAGRLFADYRGLWRLAAEFDGTVDARVEIRPLGYLATSLGLPVGRGSRPWLHLDLADLGWPRDRACETRWRGAGASGDTVSGAWRPLTTAQRRRLPTREEPGVLALPPAAGELPAGPALALADTAGAELWIAPWLEVDGAVGPLELWRSADDVVGSERLATLAVSGRPRAWADVDGDGRPDLLLDEGGACRLLLGRGADPADLEDLGRIDGWWAAAALDLLPQPGHELVLRPAGGDGEPRLFRWSAEGGGSLLGGRLLEVAALAGPLPAAGRSQGAPRAMAADADGDGWPEAWLADDEGAVWAWEVEGDGQPRPLGAKVFAERGPGAALAAARWPARDLAALFRGPADPGSSEPPWLRLRLLRPDGEGGLETVDSLDVAGGGEATLARANPPGGVDWYWLSRADGLWRVPAEYDESAAYAAAGEGAAWREEPFGLAGPGGELWLWTVEEDGAGQRRRLARRYPDLSYRTMLPDWSAACRPLDERTVRLEWTVRYFAPPGEETALWRRTGDGEPLRLATFDSYVSEFVDEGLEPGVPCGYRLETPLHGGAGRSFGPEIVLVPGPPPLLLEAGWAEPAGAEHARLELRFSQSLAARCQRPEAWWLRGEGGLRRHPRSVWPAQGGRALALVFAEAPTAPARLEGFPPLAWNGVEGPVVAVDLPAPPLPRPALALLSVERTASGELRVEFSAAMREDLLVDRARWSLDPPLELAAVESADGGRAARLRRADGGPWRRGAPLRVRTDGLVSAAGDTLRGDGASLLWLEAAAGLEDLVARPNPWRAALHGPEIVFDGLPAGARLAVYDLDGRRLARLQGDGAALRWRPAAADGRPLDSGVYLWLADDPASGQTRKGKLALIR